MAEVLRLIINEGESSLIILKYMKDNIKLIIQMNARVDILYIRKQHLTKRYVSKLQKMGITEFPTLITRKNCYSGVTRIKKFVNGGISRYNQYMNNGGQIASAPGSSNKTSANDFGGSVGGNADLQSYYMREMQSKDQESEEDDEKSEMEKKWKEYQKKSKDVAPHRTGGGSGSGSGSGSMSDDSMNDIITRHTPSENNIEQKDSIAESFRRYRENTGFNDEDTRMEQAYWNNQESSVMVGGGGASFDF